MFLSYAYILEFLNLYIWRKKRYRLDKLSLIKIWFYM
jgi:hypothetical protein